MCVCIWIFFLFVHYFSACMHNAIHCDVCIRRLCHPHRHRGETYALLSEKMPTNQKEKLVCRTTGIALQLFVDSCHMVFNASNRQLLCFSMEASRINYTQNTHSIYRMHKAPPLKSTKFGNCIHVSKPIYHELEIKLHAHCTHSLIPPNLTDFKLLIFNLL